jgi:hypothetical protein
LIIACVGDISKLQLYILSSYGLLAKITKFFSLSSPLFFEVYGLAYDSTLDDSAMAVAIAIFSSAVDIQLNIQLNIQSIFSSAVAIFSVLRKTRE